MECHSLDRRVPAPWPPAKIETSRSEHFRPVHRTRQPFCGRLSVRQTDTSSGVARGIKRDYFNLQVAVMTLVSITRAVVAHGSFTRAITR
jgi:hypothetical protein